MTIPAFPQLPYEPRRPRYQHEQGMTYRDYLIAHAPAEPQPWFQPQMRSAPREPQMPKVYREFDRAYDYDDPSEVRQFKRDHEKFLRDKHEHEEELRKQRYVQWPAAWADEVIKVSAINCTT